MNFTKREDECSVFTVSTQVKKNKKNKKVIVLKIISVILNLPVVTDFKRPSKSLHLFLLHYKHLNVKQNEYIESTRLFLLWSRVLLLDCFLFGVSLKLSKPHYLLLIPP